MTDTHVQTLEKDITALSDALARLGRGTTTSDLLKIIHRPGFTTPAEFAFFKSMIDATHGHVAAIEGLQKGMLEACKVVGS